MIQGILIGGLAILVLAAIAKAQGEKAVSSASKADASLTTYSQLKQTPAAAEFQGEVVPRVYTPANADITAALSEIANKYNLLYERPLSLSNLATQRTDAGTILRPERYAEEHEFRTRERENRLNKLYSGGESIIKHSDWLMTLPSESAFKLATERIAKYGSVEAWSKQVGTYHTGRTAYERVAQWLHYSGVVNRAWMESQGYEPYRIPDSHGGHYKN